MDKNNKSCYDCKYYLVEEHSCMKLWKSYCIKNEEESAKKCKDFIKGVYDENFIESEYWEKL